MGEGTEYNIYPPNLKEPYESRRREVVGDEFLAKATSTITGDAVRDRKSVV